MDFKNQCYWEMEDITHAFLGLNKDKSPDELDKVDDQLRQEYLKNKEWGKIDQKWYESLETNEFNDGFYGFTPVKSTTNHWGKVFENNQYIPNWSEKREQYEYELRSVNVFQQYNRLTLEISKEQYETLLNEIKKDIEKTKDRNPNLTQDDSQMVSLETLKENLYYNSYPLNKFPFHNCTTWVLNKLDFIGIEVIYTQEWIPNAPILDDLKELFPTIKLIHSTFFKFQNIDDNLKSIKGAKAFRDWARTMMNNDYICYIDDKALEQKLKAVCQTKDEILYQIFKLVHTKKMKLENIYSTLDKLLDKLIQRLKETNTNYENLKGDFKFIYFDKKDGQIKLLKASNNYEAIIIQELDLSQKHYNFSVCKFYPFIFKLKDEMILRILYHKYNYGNISQEYQKDRNEFYFNVLAGKRSEKYWSSSYHKMTKHLGKVYVS